MTKIKLMPDYFSHPLWGLDSDNIGDIDPKTLPLSLDTIAKLEAWAKTYNNILNWDDPATSGFASLEEEEEFEREGVRLWLQLKRELPITYEVVYFSDRLRRVVRDPQELELEDCPYNIEYLSSKADLG
ncbi:MAG: hypothetical protein AB4290_24155 [Spirulina sp.]